MGAVMLADDLGWGDVACFGHREIKTPNLDRLAGEGSLYTQFYMPPRFVRRAGLKCSGQYNVRIYARVVWNVSPAFRTRPKANVYKGDPTGGAVTMLQ
jgi:hypothetical protein